jgi:hypothetical protein
VTKFALVFLFLTSAPLAIASPQFTQARFEMSAAAVDALAKAPDAQLLAEATSSSLISLQPGASASQTQAPPPADQQLQAETGEQRRARAERELQAEEKQRMLGVVPNFNTVMSGEAAPIDAREKFHLFFKSSIDPFQFVAAGVDAGIEQAEDEYAAYDQGFLGYLKRYGASFADGFDGNFFGNAVLPSILHQDPRYFRLGHGSFTRRAWYSIISNVRCKGDNGKWEPNYSNVAGNFIGGAISNVYYPQTDRGLGLTLERGLTVTATGAIGSFAVEFYPDAVTTAASPTNP